MAPDAVLDAREPAVVAVVVVMAVWDASVFVLAVARRAVDVMDAVAAVDIVAAAPVVVTAEDATAAVIRVAIQGVAVVQAHVATVVWENVLLHAQVTVLDNALALLSKRDSICSVTAARATLWFLYRG